MNCCGYNNYTDFTNSPFVKSTLQYPKNCCKSKECKLAVADSEVNLLIPLLQSDHKPTRTLQPSDLNEDNTVHSSTCCSVISLQKVNGCFDSVVKYVTKNASVLGGLAFVVAGVEVLHTLHHFGPIFKRVASIHTVCCLKYRH